MGNSSSQSLHHHVLETQRQAAAAGAHQQWAHSYPRDAQRTRTAPQNKVLPERIPGQRLRITDNGAILHNGGTISGRRQSPGRYSDEDQPTERYRSRSISAHRHQQPHQRQENLKLNSKRFGSEPDLRHPAPHKESPSKQRITRTRKKYKAPTAPHLEGESHGADTSSPDSSQWEHLDPPTRRLRLFKTREETKKDLAPRGAPPRSSSPETQRPLMSKERNGRERERNVPRGRSQDKIVLNGRENDRNKPVGREQERNGRDRERNVSKGRDQERYIPNGRDQDNINRDGRRERTESREGRERERSMPNCSENERHISKGRDQERNRLEDSRNDRSRKLDRIIPNGREQLKNVSNNREPEKTNAEPMKNVREHERGDRNVSSKKDKLDRIVLNVRNHERNVPKGRMLAERGRPDHIRIMPDHGIRMKVEKDLMESPTIPRVNGFRHTPPTPTAKLIQRNLSTPEFQAELLTAAQRLRRIAPQPPPDEKSDWERDRQPRRGERRGVPVGEAVDLRPRGDGSGRESTAESLPERKKNEPRRESHQEARKPKESHWDILPPLVPQPSDRDVPTKTFYFGMEQGERDAVERFAASIHRVPANPATASGSGGSLSSDMEGDDELDGSIALQLRPMLPKKQLEIPRFSPTAAWRLLSALESPALPNIGEELPVLLEERIQRLSRPMAPPQLLQAARSSHDKSGDSGISGDASPGGCHEDSSEAPLASPPIRKTMSPTLHTAQRALVTAWTPQQDLGEEESSSDGGVDDSLPTTHGTQAKFSPRAQVFSLSLPRDERLCLALYSESSKGKRDVQPSFNSLKKLKRSVSGAFTALNTPTKVKEDANLLDENWLLSRSVTNSLNGGRPHPKPLSSTGSPSSPEHDPSSRTSFSYLATGGHVMYLPASKSRHELMPDRSYGALRANGMLSKSCENISSSEMRQLDRTPSPYLDSGGRLNGYPDMDQDMRQDAQTGKRGKNRRFTFQSTVRQIERRRISERLSREAETKERRRLGELEAMRRVEEEFQRKRAPEKANIRHQLRLFNLDEQLFSSLPNGWTDAARAEPDGATSSSPSPNADSSPEQSSGVRPPTTQILSEFREPRRDYREYRPSGARYTEIGPDSLPEKRATVHPSVVYDMPKSAHVYVASPRQANGGSSLDVDRGGMSTPRSSSSDNYRRDFAHGALRSLASSDSELSQPNTRPTSRQRSRSPSPVPDRRSKSAEPRSGSEEEQPTASVTQETPSATSARLNLTSVQPFVLNGKSYRPIAFNLGTSPSHNVAQPVN